jgi:hypothetical protein
MVELTAFLRALQLAQEELNPALNRKVTVGKANWFPLGTRPSAQRNPAMSAGDGQLSPGRLLGSDQILDRVGSKTQQEYSDARSK